MYSQNKTDNILNEIKITDEQHMENTSFTARTTTKTTSKITTKTSIKKKDAKHSFLKLSDGENLGTCITNENELPKSIKKKENMFVTLKETEENFFSEHEAMTNTKSFERNDSEMDEIQLDSIEKDDAITFNKKPKLKKNKKTSLDKQNISMKSSFTKFDALQKRNLTNNLDNENESTCHICQKPVYKMEEIKAEKFKYHKTCFRCTECNKQLKVDNYQSHEGAPFCIVHFKQLFSPKCVEDNEPSQAQKPELIIRENQPEQLPSDVVKASIKSDLGLEELQQLNLRAKFQVFENNNQQQKLTDNKKEQNNVVKNSRSISERKAQLQENHLAVREGCVTESYKESGYDDNSDDDDFTDFKDGYSREQLSCNGKALSALKKNFENGSKLSKEERREERKQEIQNIRSRLFMGKQARIKEMYQQAVAESEKAVLSINKKPDLDIGGNAHILKERFEKGELLNGTDLEDNEDGKTVRLNTLQSEADVFESAISKKSRDMFMELAANVENTKRMPDNIQSNSNDLKRSLSKVDKNTKEDSTSIIKCDEKLEEVKIKTSDLSEKFKFFETYQPEVLEKKMFRITPPREDLKSPSQDSCNKENINELDSNPNEISRTTSMMINRFREMEKMKTNETTYCPKPLKCFTPPRDCETNTIQNPEYEDDSDDDEINEQDDNYEEHPHFRHMEDEDLKKAQVAARAKLLREKFEKWEANEIQRELNDELVDIYSEKVSDDSTIESTKTIRERFENMNNNEKQPSLKQRYQVNRFV